MKLHTASEVISFVKQLENESAKFYQDLSRRYAEGKDPLSFAYLGKDCLSFARENEKNIAQIERAYHGAITDAIEGCFAFDINPDEYMFQTALAEKATFIDALDKAVEIEEKVIKFYSDASEQSKSLLADVSRAFTMIAKKRNSRLTQLIQNYMFCSP